MRWTTSWQSDKWNGITTCQASSLLIFNTTGQLLHTFFIKNVKIRISNFPSLPTLQDGRGNSEMVYSQPTNQRWFNVESTLHRLLIQRWLHVAGETPIARRRRNVDSTLQTQRWFNVYYSTFNQRRKLIKWNRHNHKYYIAGVPVRNLY